MNPLFTARVCWASIILGMGVPTTANYLITSTIMAGTVMKVVGCEMLAAHMFVFYFGIIADITPPVALAAMAGSVMRYGGLAAHSLTELEKILSGHNLGLNFGIGSDRFTMSGTTTAADFELQCKLLAAGIMHPGYRTDGEVQLRRQLPSLYNRYQTTPNGAYGLQAPRLMYGSDAHLIVIIFTFNIV